MLNDSDLIVIREIIGEQIKRTILQTLPNIEYLANTYKDILKDYHLVEPYLNHNNLWTKKNRMLNEEDAKWLEGSESISSLLDEYHCHKVSDEEGILRSNYYWRLTRPHAKGDVGPLHRDEWFWRLNNNFGENMKGYKRIKVWIGIQTEVEKNGLLVVPGSHKHNNIEWRGENTNTIIKPRLISEISPESIELVKTPPGYGIIFDDKLLHGGSINKATVARCSIEFTMICPSKEASKCSND